MYHRGPDHTGFFTDNFIALAHNRLSIIDLSSKGHQPMISRCKRYVITYNGEVFNFKELAQRYNLELESATDTEVILQLFILLGDDFVHQLNGMFAIAIYDREKMELSLFRDRIGIKPLYYAHTQEFFIFASELKAILALPEIARSLSLNHDVLPAYFQLGYIPSPHTIYHGIFKLEPGSYLKVSIDDFQKKRWWQIDDSKIAPTTLKDESLALEQLEELIESSVKLRLISDVAIGSLLSGGIDSTLVTYYAAKNHSQKLDTFCIRFEYDAYDESPWAAKIAQHIGTNHHEMTVTSAEALEMLPVMIRHYDEPYADSSAIPTMLVSKLASQHVKVALSGDGGDELFHGYGAYQWAQRLNNPVVKNLSGILGLGFYYLGNDRFRRISHLFQSNINQPLHIFSQEQYLFTGSETSELLNLEFVDIGYTSKSFRNRKLTPAEKQAIFDVYHYLPDDLLVKTDRASMLFSLENRVPLLDYRLVEWSLNLDPNLKIRQGKGKYLLRKLLEKNLPPQLFERPKKGFAVPLKIWMKNELKELFLDYLSADMIQKYHLVNVRQVENLKHKFYKHNHDYLYNRLWLIVALHMWLEQSVLKK